VTADAVIDEANLRADKRRTVVDVLDTMAGRDMLVEAPDFDDTGRYLVGPVLRRSAPSAAAVDNLSDRALHQWTARARS
jgi:hypothetical protein